MLALTALQYALQFGGDVPAGPEVNVTTGLGSGAVSAFFTTLVVGAIMIALAPDYTERMVDTVDDDAVGSFVYGVVALVALIVLTVLFAITIVGILVAIPLAIVTGIVWAVGAVIAFLAIAERLVDRSDGWLKPLLVAAALNGGLALTGIGGLVSFAVGATGFGAVLQDWR